MSQDSECQPSGEPAVATDSALPADSLFEVLSHEYRRSALAYLLDEGAASVDDLVGHVAEAADRDEGHVATLFQHAHFPKMEDYGVVDYEEDMVELTAAARQIEPALRRAK